ncbi:MAG: MFS transporter [Spirochaetaceae bacterium]|nr:MFS transporter [Spirochaetaceae bacterium]MCF7938855.1 MFS transporter [Spirochaetales bacterium]
MKRWIVLIAGVILQLIIGGVYAWSVFVPALEREYQFTTGQSALIFGLIIAVFSLAMIPAGRSLKRFGPRKTAAFGAVLFGTGYLLASLAGGHYLLTLLSLGVLTGTGIGFVYICPLTVGMQWFPEKKGLVTGVSVAGFGGGAVALSSVASFLLQQPDIYILDVFRILGITLGLLAFGGALLLSTPEQQSVKTAKTGGDLKKILFSREFLIVALGMFGGTFAGLLIVGNLKPLLLATNVPEFQATLAVSLFAVGNATGRVVWGNLFDRLGPRRTITISLASLGVGLVLLMLPLPSPLLLAVVLFVGTGFGSCFSVYALSTESIFGIDAFSTVYPMVFLGYGVAALIGPVVGGVIADSAGSFIPAIILSAVVIAGALAAVGLLYTSEPSWSKAGKQITQES